MSFRMLSPQTRLRVYSNLCPSQLHVARTRRFLHSEGSSATAGTKSYTARKEPRITLLLLVTGFVPIFTFGLGTWQLQRLQWKVNLIDELEEKLQREPLPLPKQVQLSAIPDFVYRRVRLRGRWDHQHAMLLGPRVRDGAVGYHLVEPLIRSDGSTVLVDRGFVLKEAISLKSTGNNDEVDVLGMLRTSQTRNNFTPDNRPEEEGIWHWADVDAMAAYAGGKSTGVQPVLVEEIFEGHVGEASSRITKGIPVGRPPTVDLRNAHLSYVITWYSLSAFTAFMFVRLLMKRARPKRYHLP